MAQLPEKRSDARFACRTPVEWAYFNRTEKHSARMLNFSQGGACFECSEALINGATIMVRLEDYRAECGPECKKGDECPWPRSISLGEVRWCMGLSGNGDRRFGVGVKFHLPV
jgi:hypothetical protein